MSTTATEITREDNMKIKEADLELLESGKGYMIEDPTYIETNEWIFGDTRAVILNDKWLEHLKPETKDES